MLELNSRTMMERVRDSDPRIEASDRSVFDDHMAIAPVAHLHTHTGARAEQVMAVEIDRDVNSSGDRQPVSLADKVSREHHVGCHEIAACQGVGRRAARWTYHGGQRQSGCERQDSTAHHHPPSIRATTDSEAIPRSAGKSTPTLEFTGVNGGRA